MNKLRHQPVLVYHAAEKMQKAITWFRAVLSHWNQSGKKKKTSSPLGRTEESTVNQSSQEKKNKSFNHGAPSPNQRIGQTWPPPRPRPLQLPLPLPLPPPPSATPFHHYHYHCHQHHHQQQHHHHQPSAPVPKRLRPKRKKPSCVPEKGKQTPIWDPTAKQTGFRVAGNVASFTACQLQLNTVYVRWFQYNVMSLAIQSSQVVWCHVVSWHFMSIMIWLFVLVDCLQKVPKNIYICVCVRIASYLTILGSRVPKGQPCKWRTWLKAVPVLAQEPYVLQPPTYHKSRHSSCVCGTLDSLLFASV